MFKSLAVAGLLILTLANAGAVPSVFFPSARDAYLAAEPVEIAIAGLAQGESAKLHFTPAAGSTAQPLDFSVTGTGSTVALKFPPVTFAPAVYAVTVDGQAAPLKLTISSGIFDSPMPMSQTTGAPTTGGANFLVGNLFGQGLYARDGGPQTDFSTRTLSQGTKIYNEAIAQNIPIIAYSYWTGFTTHKPWGDVKSWANETMDENMRIFNYHTAQTLRKFKDIIIGVGPLDEPGLAWGKTPAGGLASGFPNWDEKPWYEARGWKYTNDLASLSSEEFLKYMRIRCGILGECYAQGAKDMKEVWPTAIYSGDLYAVSAVADGTSALNQRANDVVTTHVFVDWGYGKVGLVGAIYCEKSHDPTALVAQATNGPLFGPTQVAPAVLDTYRMMLNANVAAGQHSNWWLNTGTMSADNLATVNEPGKRLGPLFRNIAPSHHDTAILWSFTEMANRQKEIATKESTKKDGEQIKLMIAAYPETETAGLAGEATPINAYSVGGNYWDAIIYAHDALMRAGYPTHVVHEDIVKDGALKDYKTLVIIGQTTELSPEVKKAIADFTAAGGKLVVDGTTTVSFPGALVTKADFRDPFYRWANPYGELVGSGLKPGSKLTLKQASYYQTNVFMEEMPRAAVPLMKEVMAQTNSKPALVSDSIDLPVERHVGGEGFVYMVMNGLQKLPEIADGALYPINNYVPQSATFTLQGIPAGSAVYAFEGTDWKNVRRVTDFTSPQKADFVTAEMKLYLVAPREPKGLTAKADVKDNGLQVSAALGNLKMAWPLTISVNDPAGKTIYQCWRATGADGQFKEFFPLGANAVAGNYTVSITSPAGPLEATATAAFKPVASSPVQFADSVKVFDGETIAAFLKSKPSLTIAYGSDALKPAAEKIAQTLKGKGLTASVKSETEVLHKMRYPRVWDPYLNVFEPNGNLVMPAGAEATQKLTLNSAPDGQTVLTDASGNAVAGDWTDQPGTLVTVGPDGYIDYAADQFYAPGCQMLVYLNAAKTKTIAVVDPGVTGDAAKDATRIKKVQATPENRQKWSRPWTKLTPYVGQVALPPQLPEAYGVSDNLILLGDSTQGQLVAALQAGELLMEVADPKYPGPGKALLSYAWSPFSLGKNVIFIGASDPAGLDAGIKRLGELTK